MDFSARTDKLELLDQPGIPAADIQRNLYELSVINQKLGGHAITIEGLYKLAGKQAEIEVCEIGCGGGDNLKAIEKKAKKQYPGLSLTGIDLNPECIRLQKILNGKNQRAFSSVIIKNFTSHHNLTSFFVLCSVIILKKPN